MAQIIKTVTDEQNNSVSQQETVTADTALDPIEALKEMKQTMVSKDEYDRVVAERNRIFDAYAKGERATAEESAPELVDIGKLATKLYGSEFYEGKDYQLVQDALNLRQAVIDQWGCDTFVPDASPDGKWKPTEADFLDAQRRADIYQECIDVANGDNEIFIREVSRRLGNGSSIQNQRR